MLDVIGELLAHIGRKGDAASSTGTLHAKVTDIKDNLGKSITNNTPITYPAGAFAAASSGAGNDTYGSWVEIIAANTLTGHALVAILISWPDTNGGIVSGVHEAFVQIGEGAAAAEAAIGTWAFGFAAVSGTTSPRLVIPVTPARQITANARISARTKIIAGTNNAGFGLTVAGVFVPRPF